MPTGRASAETDADAIYENVEPVLPLGLPFARTAVSEEWFNWPSLPDLFPGSFPGVQTARDGFLVDIDLDRLRSRISDYFDSGLRHEDIARLYPGVMRTTARYNARAVRDTLLERGGPDEDGFIRFAYRPFDNRWLYWEQETKLLDEKRADYRPHVLARNLSLVAQRKPRRTWSPPQVISHIGCLDLLDRGATCIPVWLQSAKTTGSGEGEERDPNLSGAAQRYLVSLDKNVEDLFHHVLSVLHDPNYREANAGALRMEWPRIPLPGWRDGKGAGAEEIFAASAVRGCELARLLNPESSVTGVTVGSLRPEIAVIGVPSTTDGRNMAGEDFSGTAGWGHTGSRGAIMPGQGRIVERAYTPDECAAIDVALPVLGESTFDIYLNARAFWRNIPVAVWNYKLGGYQVLKKWLSYRERDIVGRPLRLSEIEHFTDTARRIAAILLTTKQSPEAMSG